MLKEIEIDEKCLPKGHKLVALRRPRVGELMLTFDDLGPGVLVATQRHTGRLANILEKEQQWRPATPQDAIEGKACRVRDNSSNEWEDNVLCGFNRRGTFPWLVTRAGTSNFSAARYAEVLDS